MWIIPARAGFTPVTSPLEPVSWDHPRSRGVYISRLVGTFWCHGSSPLARGLRRAAGRGQPGYGIIPARAGFTHRRSQHLPRRQDHPRSRGVYCVKTHDSPHTNGSSPLARGLLTTWLHEQALLGIIPARAGFTRLGRLPPPCGPDHPRSRGVYRVRLAAWCGWAGSSPLARGLLAGGGGVRPIARIIPARAGFTIQLGSRTGYLLDHPRSRGVYRATAAGVRVVVGSSPLARGLRHPLPAVLDPLGGSSPLARGLRAAAHHSHR